MRQPRGATKDFVDTILADPVAWWHSSANWRNLGTWMRLQAWMLSKGWVCEPGPPGRLPWLLRRVKPGAAPLFSREG
jgi:hypothetical protein